MLRLIREQTAGSAAFGTAVSHALLLRVAAGELPPTIRLHRARPVLSFGKQDALQPGFGAAVAAARAHGFDPVLRLAGGRAAVFSTGTLAFAWSNPEAKPRDGVHERFTTTAELLVQAFGGLGIDARIGEVPGEYCPGAYSVNAGGRVKLSGVGQRLVSGGAHVGGVVVAEGSAALRSVLVAVYEALGLDWEPRTVGAAADLNPDARVEATAAAIVAELERSFDLAEARLDAQTLALARELEGRHAIAL